MPKKHLAVLTLMVVAISLPAAAYHITGAPAQFPPGHSSGDWAFGGEMLVLCESDGPADSVNPQPAPRSGISGALCYSGQNMATGSPPPAPPVQQWVRLDVCDVLVIDREVALWPGLGGPYGPGDVGRCDVNGLFVGGNTDQHAFGARVGAFSCEVPAVYSGTVTRDYALYYDELYAWWSISPGHVMVAPRSIGSALGHSLEGSVETLVMDAANAAPEHVDFFAALGSGLFTAPTSMWGEGNNCGASPPTGPVIRAPNFYN